MLNIKKVAWSLAVMLFVVFFILSSFTNAKICLFAVNDGSQRAECYSVLKSVGLSVFTIDKKILDQTSVATQQPIDTLIAYKKLVLIGILLNVGALLFIVLSIVLISIKIVSIGSSDGRLNSIIRYVIVPGFVLSIYTLLMIAVTRAYFPQGDYHYPFQGIVTFIKNISLFI